MSFMRILGPMDIQDILSVMDFLHTSVVTLNQ